MSNKLADLNQIAYVVKIAKLIDKPKSVTTGIVQIVQKTVNEPIMNPIPEVEVARSRVAFLL